MSKPLTLNIIKPTNQEKDVKSRRTTDPNDKRAEQNRQSQQRYAEKLKPYQQLAKLTSLEEQMVGLMLISHPEYALIPKYELLQHISTFLRSINDKYKTNN